MNELSISVGASFNDGDGVASLATKTKRTDSVDAVLARGKTLTNTAENIAFPAATGRIGAVIVNQGDTNNILVSFDDGSTFPISIPPGGSQPIWLASGTADIKIKTSASTTLYDVLAA